jgi:hypothetical protein
MLTAEQIAEAQRLKLEGRTTDEIVSAIRTLGATKLDSVRILVEIVGLRLLDAKRVVHESPVWADRHYIDEHFLDAELLVLETVEFSNGRGLAAFLAEQPTPRLPWRLHRVRVMTPQGKTYVAIAQVESIRKDGDEQQALRFKELRRDDLPLGSRILILGLAEMP